MKRKTSFIFVLAPLALSGYGGVAEADTFAQKMEALKDCAKVAREGFRPIAEDRRQRFLGKVQRETANCRGGQKALKYMGTPEDYIKGRDGVDRRALW